MPLSRPSVGSSETVGPLAGGADVEVRRERRRKARRTGRKWLRTGSISRWFEREGKWMAYYFFALTFAACFTYYLVRSD